MNRKKRFCLAFTVMVLCAAGLFFHMRSSARACYPTYEVYTSIPDIFIVNPADNEVWLVQSPHDLECTFAWDTDRIVATGVNVDDTVTYWWVAGAGSFKLDDWIGRDDVTYFCPAETGDGNIVITANVDDDYAPADNEYLANDAGQWDTKLVELVGCGVYEIDFGGDHLLYHTPPDDEANYGGWGDGIFPIGQATAQGEQPVWRKELGVPAPVMNKAVCMTKRGLGTSLIEVKWKSAAPLTEAATFQVMGDPGITGYGWAPCSLTIAENEDVSNPGTMAIVGELPDMVYHYELGQNPFVIDWWFYCEAGRDYPKHYYYSNHQLFLTYGTPTWRPDEGPQELTVKRIKECVTACMYRLQWNPSSNDWDVFPYAAPAFTDRDVADRVWERLSSLGCSSDDAPHTGSAQELRTQPGWAGLTPKQRKKVRRHFLSNDWKLMYGDPSDPVTKFFSDIGLSFSSWYQGECNEMTAFTVRYLKLLGMSDCRPYLTFPSTDDIVDRPEEWKKEYDYDNDWIDEPGPWELKFFFGAALNHFEGSIEAAGHYYTLWPKLEADTKLALFRKIGSPPVNATQHYVKYLDSEGKTYLKGEDDISFP